LAVLPGVVVITADGHAGLVVTVHSSSYRFHHHRRLYSMLEEDHPAAADSFPVIMMMTALSLPGAEMIPVRRDVAVAIRGFARGWVF
jgi:hypothetical protein